MAQFKYTARNNLGKMVEGTIDAQVQKLAIERLRGQKFTVMSLTEVKVGAPGNFMDSLNPFKGKIKSKDLVIFSRQLATLVSAGVPIVQGLNILADQIESPAFKKVIAG